MKMKILIKKILKPIVAELVKEEVEKHATTIAKDVINTMDYPRKDAAGEQELELAVKAAFSKVLSLIQLDVVDNPCKP
jgi:hypothetical protein